MDSYRSFLGPTSNEVLVEEKLAAIYGFDPGPVKAMACKILLQFLRPLRLLLAKKWRTNFSFELRCMQYGAKWEKEGLKGVFFILFTYVYISIYISVQKGVHLVLYRDKPIIYKDYYNQDQYFCFVFFLWNFICHEYNYIKELIATNLL